MSTATPTCSVIVCTHNRPQALDGCLDAVMAGLTDRAEVVVVDSAPEDDRAKEVAARRGARYVREERPGVSRARNRATRETDSDILAYVDGDALPEPGWLTPLIAEFADPAVAAVAGKVLPPVSEMDMLPVYAWFGIADHGSTRRVFDRSVPRWFELSNFESVLLGANMAIRRSAFLSWRGFDERIGAGTSIHGGEEPMAFFELVESGFRVVYAPGSVVRHPFPRSEEQLRRRAISAIESASAYLALLLLERPEYRKCTWGYIRDKLKKVRPVYARETAVGRPLLSGWRVMAARAKGAWLGISMTPAGRGRRSLLNEDE